MAMWWPGFYGGLWSPYAGGYWPVLDVANEAGEKAREAKTQVAELAREIDRLSMITQALWLILKEENGYDDEVLRKKVMEIDLKARHAGEEGADAPGPCPKCGRPLARRHPRCIYCGAERKLDVFER